MINLLTLLSQYPIWTVLIIVIAVLIIIQKGISFFKAKWGEREQFIQDNVNKGMEIQKKKDMKEEAQQEEIAHINELQTSVTQLTELLEKQQKLIDLLIQSDELEIKAWIKEQHEKWAALRAIDSQSLDVLEQRFAIYEKEGGNSWALKLMNEIRALPTITVIPVPPSNPQQHN